MWLRMLREAASTAGPRGPKPATAVHFATTHVANLHLPEIQNIKIVEQLCPEGVCGPKLGNGDTEIVRGHRPLLL
jgi:hypothetical protein